MGDNSMSSMSPLIPQMLAVFLHAIELQSRMLVFALCALAASYLPEAYAYFDKETSQTNEQRLEAKLAKVRDEQVRYARLLELFLLKQVRLEAELEAQARHSGPGAAEQRVGAYVRATMANFDAINVCRIRQVREGRLHCY